MSFARFAWGLVEIFSASIFVASMYAAGKPEIPPLSNDVQLASQPGKETAVFAGGCFWGVQAVFQRVKGVLSTTAGTQIFSDTGACWQGDLNNTRKK